MTTMDGASASTWQKNPLSLIVLIFFSYILEISWSSWLNFTMNRAPIPPSYPGDFLGELGIFNIDPSWAREEQDDCGLFPFLMISRYDLITE